MQKLENKRTAETQRTQRKEFWRDILHHLILRYFVYLKVVIFSALIIAYFAVQPAILLAAQKTSQDIYEWGYVGDKNPNEWGNISSEFSLCKLGENQSPINIINPEIATSVNLDFNYHPSPLSVIDTGHSIQVNYQSGSTITINDEKYELLQFHFHTPSEHQINNQKSAMEMHLVHQSKSGKLAVVGVMMEEGNSNAAIEEIILSLVGKNDFAMINVADLLPQNKAYFSYTGSLTTPPCSENVKWQILKQTIQLSAGQIQFFQNLYKMNSRPVQTLNNREVTFYP